MKHLTDTIREALEFFECGSYSTSKALSALSELERLAGEQKPVARVDGEGQVAWFAPIPEDGANLYATPPALIVITVCVDEICDALKDTK